MSETYQQLLTVLERYVSSITADSMLRRALRDAQLRPEQLTVKELPRLITTLRTGIRLFVDSHLRNALEAELKRLSGVPSMMRAQKIVIREEADASRARAAARTMCEEMGGRSLIAQKLATGVSELARNIRMYAGTGTLELLPSLEPQPKILARAIDEGSGIPNLEEIWGGGYKSRTGLGRGLLGVRRMADRFAIETGPQGTRVEFEVWL